MPLKLVKIYTREQIQAHPDWLYVFGDNFLRLGFGGQAGAARGEPNAIGIATKHLPANSDEAFFSDGDFDLVKAEIDTKFQQLNQHLANNKVVVWPKDGIGTGLADLPNRAPKIWNYLTNKYNKLAKIYLD